MVAEARKQAAVDFLTLVVARRIDEAYAKHIAPGALHHNPFFAAGMDALQAGMREAHAQSPDTKIKVHHVVGDGDLVAVHSHVTMKPGDAGVAVVHLFRFRGDKVVEFWDVGQEVPKESPNKDGMF